MTTLEQILANQQDMANFLDELAGYVRQNAGTLGAQQVANLRAQLSPAAAAAFGGGLSPAGMPSGPTVGAGPITPVAVIAPGVVDSTAFASSIRAPQVVDTLPTLPDADWPTGSLVVLTSDGKLYRNVSGTWTAAVPTADLTGTISAAQIGAGTITADKMVANTLTAGTIAAGAIGTDELAANAVTAEKVTVGLANLVDNPGFETGDLTGWTSGGSGTGSASVSTAAPHTGAYGAQIVATNTGGRHLLSGLVPARVGDVFVVSAWMHASVSTSVQLGYTQYSASRAALASLTHVVTVATGADLLYNSGAIEVTASSTAFVAFFVQSDTVGTLSLDDVTAMAGGVIIDRDGITIYDGALDFQDQYGGTLLNGSGFGDAYADDIGQGIFNGAFARSSAGTPGSSDGWTLSTGGTFNPQMVNGIANAAGYAVRYTATGASSVNGSITSGFITVVGLAWYRILARLHWLTGSSTVSSRVNIIWYDATQTLISTTNGTYVAWVADGFDGGSTGVTQAPARARYASIQVEFKASAAGSVELWSIGFEHFIDTIDFIPPGTIVLWSGSVATIPQGWNLCDGNHSTPDLTGRFIVGLASGSPASGGSVSPTAALAHASHKHTQGATGSNTSDTVLLASGADAFAAFPSHSHTNPTTAGTTVGAHAIPKYYTLAYIMKS